MENKLNDLKDTFNFNHILNSRQINKSYFQYNQFISSVRNGENSIVFGNGYVVISEKEYKKLLAKSKK